LASFDSFCHGNQICLKIAGSKFYKESKGKKPSKIRFKIKIFWVFAPIYLVMCLPDLDYELFWLMMSQKLSYLKVTLLLTEEL
jgi:type IV secretory pathway TrbL component